MYQVVFAEDVLEELSSIVSGAERRKMISAIQCLAATPESPGIGEAIDSQGRVNRIGVLGSTAFVFAADHALRKLRILAVQPVGE